MSRPVLLALLLGFLILLRVTAPSDLLEGAQSKQVGYVMDILLQQHWLLQYEINGDVATKPPLYNWCAALLSHTFNTDAEWIMKLPSLLSGLGLLGCIYWLARRSFDAQSAFYAVIACLASHHFSKLFWFARTDMLMTFLLYLAIVVQLSWRPGWYRTIGISLIIAACTLTKGPTGPLLYLVFLFTWAVENEAWHNRKSWLHLGAGTAVVLLLAGGWLLAVWQLPQFQDRVVYWQLGERLAEPVRARHWSLPIAYLFTRIAPWPITALIGAWISRREGDRWPETRMYLLWTVLFLSVFCLIPVKRHDHLLPVYPPVFVLAGVGLKQFLEPVLLPRARWVMLPLCGVLLLSPVLLPWVDEPQVWGLVALTFLLGALALLVYLHGRRWAFVIGATGLISLHGIYHHQIHGAGRADYAQLLSFIREVQGATSSSNRLAVYQAHPLIAYELRQHETLVTPQDVARLHPQFVITTEDQIPQLSEALRSSLTPVERLSLAPRHERATLYRVEQRSPSTQWAEAPQSPPH